MPLKDPAARKAYQKAYLEKNRERLVARITEWKRNKYRTDPEYRERVKAASRKTGQPHIRRAHQRVYQAIKRGDLVRPESCESCGTRCKPEAAHHTYERPLDVRWLCRSCHRKWDATEPKSGTPGAPIIVRSYKRNASGRFIS